jgi:hypothetical protein
MTLSQRLAAARDDRRVAAGLPLDLDGDADEATVLVDGRRANDVDIIDLRTDQVVIDLRARRRARAEAPAIADDDDFLASLRDPNAVLAYDWVPSTYDDR